MNIGTRLLRWAIATGTLLLFIATPHLSAQHGAVDLSGDWSYTRNGYSFTLKLSQRGDSLVGAHCAVTRNATRIDCAYAEEGSAQPVSLAGAIRNGRAIVRFTSAYSDATGDARILVRGRRIEWSIIKGSVSGGEFYLPMTATLSRTTGNH